MASKQGDIKVGDIVWVICPRYPQIDKHEAMVTKISPDGYIMIEYFCISYRQDIITKEHIITNFGGREPLYIAKKLRSIRSNMKLSKATVATGIVLSSLLVIGMWFSGNYNSLVSSRNAVDNSWAKVETQYQRRLDLVDNIVVSVKSSQLQEQAVFGKIAESRTAYSNAKTTEEKAQAASQMETNIAVLPRLQEAYPELKSNEQVTRLIGELSGTENGIAEKRDAYNDTVTNYNNNITRFPKSLFAGMFNFDKATLFKSASGAEKAPKVNL